MSRPWPADSTDTPSPRAVPTTEPSEADDHRLGDQRAVDAALVLAERQADAELAVAAQAAHEPGVPQDDGHDQDEEDEHERVDRRGEVEDLARPACSSERDHHRARIRLRPAARGRRVERGGQGRGLLLPVERVAEEAQHLAGRVLHVEGRPGRRRCRPAPRPGPWPRCRSGGCPTTMKLRTAMPPYMVAPMSVAVRRGRCRAASAKASLSRISPGRSGRRPRTTALSRFRSRRSGLPGERRSTARPAAGPWARVSPCCVGDVDEPAELDARRPDERRGGRGASSVEERADARRGPGRSAPGRPRAA